jgi:hypothetical protein
MTLHFAHFSCDIASRQLWVRGREAHLSPKAFELLALLIERRPHAVSKQDIRERLWPGTFVTESNLPTLISEIREALGDTGKNPRIIRTLHRIGYAFQAAPLPARGPAALVATPHGWLLGPAAEIALFDGENVLGREGSGVILLKSGTVSRRHARLTIDDQRAVLEDLGSKNGTYVNDERVNGPTLVAEGDQVRIGSLLFTFRSAQRTATTETQSGRGTDAQR